jgi:hypothetical protein
MVSCFYDQSLKVNQTKDGMEGAKKICEFDGELLQRKDF